MSRRRSSLAVLLVGWAASVAVAEDTVIDFDHLAVGTVVTTQYEGVTFSTVGNSCDGSPIIRAIIVTPTGGTSSSPRALGIQTGCPDFSTDYLRIVFGEAHRRVSFTLGDFAGTYAIRAYSTTSGGSGVVFSQSVTLGGTGFIGVHRLVTIARAAAEIRRVEIENTIDLFETIDDLTFDCPDATAPVAEITSPAPLACVCSGDDVLGSAYDADHDIANYRLERKAPDAAAWTLIRVASTEVVDGLLSNWSTAAAQGYYVLRLTVTNLCDLVDTATTVVWLDRQFDSFDLRTPAADAIVGGTLCADGTIWDHCGGVLTLKHRALPGGAGVDFDHVAASWVINDPLGSWNTRGSPDGDYEVRAEGIDQCGHSASTIRRITVDNTPPTARLFAPLACQCVNGVVDVVGTAYDAHLRGWVLQYAGDGIDEWTTIATGNDPMVDELLGRWDTRNLDPCPYMLRLLVTDSAIVDCDDPHVSEALVSVDVGPCRDFDADDDGDVDLMDFAEFESEFTGP